jgi:hypothetical protein
MGQRICPPKGRIEFLFSSGYIGPYNKAEGLVKKRPFSVPDLPLEEDKSFRVQHRHNI